MSNCLYCLCSHIIDICRQVVAWVMRAYKGSLPKVDTATVVMAVLMDLEAKKQPHLIIKRLQV